MQHLQAAQKHRFGGACTWHCAINREKVDRAQIVPCLSLGYHFASLCVVNSSGDSSASHSQSPQWPGLACGFSSNKKASPKSKRTQRLVWRAACRIRFVQGQSSGRLSKKPFCAFWTSLTAFVCWSFLPLIWTIAIYSLFSNLPSVATIWLNAP